MRFGGGTAARQLGCVVALIALAASCAGPTVVVAVDPANSAIDVDGRRLDPDDPEFVQPYYGIMRVEAVPPPRRANEPSRRAVQRMVVLDEPVSPWLFPFDLGLELLTYPLRTRETRIELQAEPRPALPTGESPPQLPELRERALDLRTAR